MEQAGAWGILIEWRPLGDDVRGFYEHDVRTITLNSSLPQDLLRSALAHELGHAHHGHGDSDDWLVVERNEVLADQYAAQLLITADAYAAAEQLVGPHAGAIALELGCAVYTVEAWQSLQREHRDLRRTA